MKTYYHIYYALKLSNFLVIPNLPTKSGNASSFTIASSLYRTLDFGTLDEIHCDKGIITIEQRILENVIQNYSGIFRLCIKSIPEY